MLSALALLHHAEHRVAALQARIRGRHPLVSSRPRRAALPARQNASTPSSRARREPCAPMLTRRVRVLLACAEACEAGQPIKEMQDQRKCEWQQCLDLLHQLGALCADAEGLRASTPRMPALLAGAAPGGGDQGAGEGWEGGGVQMVQAMMDGAREQVEEWRELEAQERLLLRARTDEAAAPLRPQVSLRLCSPARSRTLRQPRVPRQGSCWVHQGRGSPSHAQCARETAEAAARRLSQRRAPPDQEPLVRVCVRAAPRRQPRRLASARAGGAAGGAARGVVARVRLVGGPWQVPGGRRGGQPRPAPCARAPRVSSRWLGSCVCGRRLAAACCPAACARLWTGASPHLSSLYSQRVHAAGGPLLLSDGASTDGGRSSLVQCGLAVADADRRSVGLGEAVLDPHLVLLDKVASVRQQVKKRERALRDAKRRLEDVKEDVQEEQMGDVEAAALVEEAEASIGKERSALQRCLRDFRENLAEIARLSMSRFPEVPWCVRKREHKDPLLVDLFMHEPEVVKLLAVDRKLSHYSDVHALSRPPDSRHDVDAASFDGERVAIKKYNLSRCDSLKTLRQELVVLATLRHPNIIPVQLFFVEETSAAYVEFPLYERDMEVWLATRPGYPDVHAAVHDVVRAVEYMHGKPSAPSPVLARRSRAPCCAHGVSAERRAVLRVMRLTGAPPSGLLLLTRRGARDTLRHPAQERFRDAPRLRPRGWCRAVQGGPRRLRRVSQQQRACNRLADAHGRPARLRGHADDGAGASRAAPAGLHPRL